MTAALFWEWNVRCGREAGSKLGPELYLELRYEALIDGTEEECARLCSFLGIPYDNAMLLFHQGRTLNEPGLDAKKAWRPVTAGLRNWRQEMAAGDVARFEAAAGHLLNELGYGGEAAPPSEDQLVRAAHLRKAFDSDARNRRRPAAGACESERA
jgi:hypothetical protein